MASSKAERNETEKYIKFFTFKALQVIIHSRSGEKSKTFSNANAVGVDWFNIALPGSNVGTEVQKEIKTEFGSRKAVVQDPLWLYVYLKTSEGFDSLLESWNMSFIGKPDPSIKSSFAVYNKLALLLKSLVSVTRSLPAHKLTRRKEKDFSFYYKICTQELDSEKAVSLPKAARIGSVGTPYGTVVLTVNFQTQIDLYTYEQSKLPSTESARQKVLIKMTKDDPLDSLNPLEPSAVEELRRAALEDVVGSTASLPTSFTTMSPKHFDLSQLQDEISDLHLSSISQLQAVGAVNDGHGAFAAFGEVSMEKPISDAPDVPSTPPFLSFIQSKIDESMTDQSLKPKAEETISKDNQESDKSINDKEVAGDSLDNTENVVEPTAQAVGFEDDFVLVEVRPAFAPQTGDAGQLYRECQNPPQLDMFNDKNNYDSDNDGSFSDQIERFESQLAQFDEFFRNLEHMQVS